MNHRCVADSDITVKCVVLIAYKRQMIGFFGMVFSIYICFATKNIAEWLVIWIWTGVSKEAHTDR